MKYILLLLTILNIALFSQDKDYKNEEDHDDLRISPSMFEEIGISFTSLKQMVLENQIKAYGEVISTNNGSSDVGTLLSGRIGTIHVQLGQEVKKGDKLFEISSLEVMELMDNYFSRVAELKRATQNFNRLKTLRKENIGSEKAFFEAQSDYEKSKAQFESTDRKIHAIGFTDEELNDFSESKKHHSANMNVKAPISGIITQLSIKQGQFVSGEEILAEILNPKELWARLHVYEKNISKIKIGSNVDISSPKNKLIKSFGTVISKSHSFMKGKKSVEVIVSIENAQNFILGSNINAVIFNSSGKKSWILPDQSVIKEGTKSFVFIHEKDGVFEKKEVLIGKEVSGFIQILKGVDKNERVVENGSFYLKALSKGDEIGGHDH